MQRGPNKSTQSKKPRTEAPMQLIPAAAAFLPEFTVITKMEDRKRVNREYEHLTQNEFFDYIANNPETIEILKANPTFIERTDIHFLIELGRRNNSFGSFLFHKIADLKEMKRNGLEELTDLVENNPELAMEIFNNKELVRELPGKDIATLCQANALIARQVIEDRKNRSLGLRFFYESIDVARAVYKHESLVNEILSDKNLFRYLENYYAFELIGQNQSSVAQKIFDKLHLVGLLSSRKTIINISCANLPLFVNKILPLIGPDKEAHIFDIIPFNLSGDDFAKIAEKSLEHARAIWNDKTAMARFSWEDKAKIASHHPELALELLSDAYFLKDATGKVLSILGSKHQKPAERIYGSIGLKNRLSASDLARLAVKHHFIAADIFLSKTLQDSMSANDLASMGLHGSNYCLVMILNNDQLRNRVEPDYLKEMEKRYQSVAALQAAIKPIAEIEKEIKEEKVENPKLRARKR